MMNKKRIDKVLNHISNNIGVKVSIDEEYSKNINDFCMFCYNSSDYLNNGNISSALVGNQPIIYSKDNDKLYQLINSDIDLNDYKFKDLIDKNIIEEIKI